MDQLIFIVCGRSKRAGLGFASVAVLLLASLPAFAADPTPAALTEHGHFKRAQVILAERLKANPNDAQALCDMSKVSIAFLRRDDAVQQAEKALAIDGKSVDFHVQLVEALGSKLDDTDAGMFARMSLARRFRKEAEITLQLDPNNIDANEDLMEFHLDAPGIVGGDQQKADEIAERMTHISPVHGYLMKVEIALHDRRTAEIGPLLRQAINADPKNYSAQMRAANFYLEQGGAALAQAEAQAKQAIAIAPDRVSGYTALAVVYTQQARWNDLEALLKDAQTAVPDDLAPLYQSAKNIVTNNQIQQMTRAEGYLRSYLAQPPEGGEPSLAGAHWRLGLVLEKQGHKDQARQELQTAVTLDPKFEPAKKDLKRLQ